MDSIEPPFPVRRKVRTLHSVVRSESNAQHGVSVVHVPRDTCEVRALLECGLVIRAHANQEDREAQQEGDGETDEHLVELAQGAGGTESFLRDKWRPMRDRVMREKYSAAVAGALPKVPR